MFNQNRIYRVFQLIQFLQGRSPKPIQSIVRFLNTSERTVYRYLDLLKDLGFRLERDELGRYKIENRLVIPLDFTEQERIFLETLLTASAAKNVLAASVLEKVKSGADIEHSADALYRVHLARMVEQLSQAISGGYQVMLKSYASANSQLISDRLVEPVSFTDNYRSLAAFEPSSKMNKYFNVERMGAVEVLDTPFMFAAEHQFNKPDVFGYQHHKFRGEVEWEMSMRAYLLLREEYPLAIGGIKPLEKSGRYMFRSVVHSFEAPGRFVNGWDNEIKVTGSKEFLKFLKMFRSRVD
jgi:proteasome accessory factor C